MKLSESLLKGLKSPSLAHVSIMKRKSGLSERNKSCRIKVLFTKDRTLSNAIIEAVEHSLLEILCLVSRETEGGLHY